MQNMKKRKYEIVILMAPAIILLIFIMVLPLMLNLYYSFSSLDYMNFKGFVGFKYYKQFLADSEFYRSFGITILISISAVAISMIFGILLALWVDHRDGTIAYLVELVGLIPWAISMVVAGLLWKWVFNGEMGLFNFLLQKIGIKPINLFASAETSIIAVIFVMAWRTIGYSMILMLAGLKGISHDIVEAATVDGARSSQIFWKIKLPLIKTPLLISTIVITMSNFNNNIIPMVLTGGGPGNATNVLTLRMYQLGFEYFQFGMASALSVLIFLINIILVIAYVKEVKYEL